MDKHKLECIQDDLVKKTNENYKLKKELANLQERQEKLSHTLDETSQALEWMTQQYNQTLSSKSWKMTEGLRKLYPHCMSRASKRLHFRRKWQKVQLLRRLNKNAVLKTDFKLYKDRHSLVGNSKGINDFLTDIIDGFVVSGDIKISVVMPVYNVDTKWLDKAIWSVRNQRYTNWELCIVDDHSTCEATKAYLNEIHDDNIKIQFLTENCGISKATNKAVSMSTGEFIILLDNDDELLPDALLECYRAIKEDNPDIIYSDHDIISADGVHSNPMFKPDWSPDLLLCQMYMGHLVGFKREVFDIVGGFQSEFDGAQDYDLILRMSEKTSKIKHISKILYSWRALESSTAMNADSKPYAQTAGLLALQAHFDRIYGKGYATAYETNDMYVYDVRYHTLHNELISIIIPTKDHSEDLKVAIDSILQRTSYKNYEIIILDNRSEKKETFVYFDQICSVNKNIRVIKADCEFNWSKINNIGIREAAGEIFLFLNNDIKVLKEDWLERLAENALREDVGIVGGLLLYEDGTIQHAGVVIGYGGYADHVFKGMRPEHIGCPYVSSLVTRNVTAVTGACMAISKKHLDEIGMFDENFIVCASDVELCIRAYKRGYYNVYTPFVRLYHYESKSRGSYVPENDCRLSRILYDEFLKNGDPYYNSNLSYESCRPMPVSYAGTIWKSQESIEVFQPEITPMHFRKIDFEEKRINIILPSINKRDVFGGIATALNFFDAFAEKSGWARRIIISDANPDEEAIEMHTPEYMFCDSSEDALASSQIVPYADRAGKTIPVSDHDYFIFTGWWTAYCIQEEYLMNASSLGLKQNVFMYLIQDYEPGFYPWSSQYMFAELTYKTEQQQIAIFNSTELRDYFKKSQYSFAKEFVFDPVLNEGLRKALPKAGDYIRKKKQILVYGRPSTARNAFALLVEILKKWVDIQEDVHEWTILAAGESFEPVNLGKGQRLISVGKLSIENYASLLKETYAGVSLMVSPHPSYPPLEMSVFGVKTITNMYANKNLDGFNDNIYSLENILPVNVAKCLQEICSDYSMEIIYRPCSEAYCEAHELFPFIGEILAEL